METVTIAARFAILREKASGNAWLMAESMDPDASVRAVLPDGRILRFADPLSALLDRVEELSGNDLWPGVAPFEAGANLIAVHLMEAVETASADATTLHLVPAGIVAR